MELWIDNWFHTGVDKPFEDLVEQGCQTRGLMEDTLYVGNRAWGRMMF